MGMKFLLLGICTLFLLGCEDFVEEQENQVTRGEGNKVMREQGGKGEREEENVIASPKDEAISEITSSQAPRDDIKERKTVYADIDLEAQTITYQEKIFQLEIADTFASRRTGLMNRTSLEPGKGMLFIFEKEGVYPFWMKNTLIPLTMVWIAEDGQVVDQQDAIPCRQETCPNYVPAGEAKYVLEVNMGELEWPF